MDALLVLVLGLTLTCAAVRWVARTFPAAIEPEPWVPFAALEPDRKRLLRELAATEPPPVPSKHPEAH